MEMTLKTPKTKRSNKNNPNSKSLQQLTTSTSQIVVPITNPVFNKRIHKQKGHQTRKITTKNNANYVLITNLQ